jgi:hypothetical protein
MRNGYKVLVAKAEGKRPPGIPRRNWENNIGIDLRERGLEIEAWIYLALDMD